VAPVSHLSNALPLPDQPEERLVAIHCVGREFVTRLPMARIFLRRSSDVVADGGSELVPLLHQGGLEMIFVSDHTDITVSEITVTDVTS
jgi:hypothetical protein